MYKGSLENVGSRDEEPRMVAVKKLTNQKDTSLQDFEREIDIMKVNISVCRINFMRALFTV